MEWVILDALVSLALGFGILWWALSPSRRREREKEARDAHEDQRHVAQDEDVR